MLPTSLEKDKKMESNQDFSCLKICSFLCLLSSWGFLLRLCFKKAARVSYNHHVISSFTPPSVYFKPLPDVTLFSISTGFILCLGIRLQPLSLLFLLFSFQDTSDGDDKLQHRQREKLTFIFHFVLAAGKDFSFLDQTPLYSEGHHQTFLFLVCGQSRRLKDAWNKMHA